MAYPQSDEHMITITLSSDIIKKTVKIQHKYSYKHIENIFKTGKACIEFTKQGNIHYHIKTKDDIADIYTKIDNLKTIKYKSNDKLYNVFGYTKIDKTMQEDQINNYDYILKNYQQTETVFKRMKINQKATWDFTEKEITPKKHRINLKSIIRLDEGVDSDTMEWIDRIRP